MTYANHPPPPPPFLPPPPFTNNILSRQDSMNSDDVDSNPRLDHSLKRPRSSINNKPLSHPNPQINRGTGYIFYKTRMCLKFLDNNCRNGDQCTFAHGAKDLREPPPNWQEIVGRKEMGNGFDDQRPTYRFKICKKYANGEECPYGENCNFLHKRGLMSFDADVDGPRESAAIRIGTNASMMTGNRTVPDQIEVMSSSIDNNKQQLIMGQDAFRATLKATYWKTKLCSKWEVTGHCPFEDKCHFAHGEADLQLPGGQTEPEPMNNIPAIPPMNPVFIPTTGTSEINAAIVPPAPENEIKKLDQKWKGAKKLNGIYGDWLNDMAPPLMYPKSIES